MYIHGKTVNEMYNFLSGTSHHLCLCVSVYRKRNRCMWVSYYLVFFFFFVDIVVERHLILSNLLVKTVNFVVYIQWITYNSTVKWLFTYYCHCCLTIQLWFARARERFYHSTTYSSIFTMVGFSSVILLLQFGRIDEFKCVQRMKNDGKRIFTFASDLSICLSEYVLKHFTE